MKSGFAMIILIAGCWCVAIQGFAQPSSTPPRSLVAETSVVAYSREFAKRFALPDPAPGMELTGPLQALEFKVEPSRYITGANECLLSVYIESHLPLQFPTDDRSGSKALAFSQSHFFVHPNKGREHWLKLSLEDRRHFGGIDSPFNRNAALATRDWGQPDQKGGMFSSSYREFHRELFPGLAYLQLQLLCPLPRWVGVLVPTQLWLKRAGGKDYTRIIQYDPNDFERLDLPSAFVERMSALEQAARDRSSSSMTPQGNAGSVARPETPIERLPR